MRICSKLVQKEDLSKFSMNILKEASNTPGLQESLALGEEIKVLLTRNGGSSHHSVVTLDPIEVVVDPLPMGQSCQPSPSWLHGVPRSWKGLKLRVRAAVVVPRGLVLRKKGLEAAPGHAAKPRLPVPIHGSSSWSDVLWIGQILLKVPCSSPSALTNASLWAFSRRWHHSFFRYKSGVTLLTSPQMQLSCTSPSSHHFSACMRTTNFTP